MRRFALALCFVVTVIAADPFTVTDALDVANLTVADLSDDGRWLAATSSRLRDRIGIDNARFGDPTYVAPLRMDVWVIDTRSGASQKLFPDRRQVRGLKWSPDGSRLALLMLSGDRFVPAIWNRESRQLDTVPLPPGKMAGDSLDWTPDGSRLVLALRSEDQWKKAADRFRKETAGPVVVQSSKDPFLAWDELRRMPLLQSLAAYDTKTRQVAELLAERPLNGFDLTADGATLTFLNDVSKKTDYDVIFGRESEIRGMPASGGESRVILKSNKGLSLIWSESRRHYAYGKEGMVYFASIDDKEPKLLIGKKPDDKKDDKKAEDKKPAEETEAEKEEKAKQRFSPVSLSPNGDRMIATNKEGMWLVNTATGDKELFLKTPEDDKLAPRYAFAAWKPDASAFYLTYSARTKWQRGLVRYDNAAKTLADVFKDGRIYNAPRFSKDGSTMVVSAAESNRPGDLFAATGDFKELKRIAESNPQLKTKQLSRTELISYRDVDGKKLNGVLYYPAEYQQGKLYPLVVNVYEQFFDDNFQAAIAILNANGYAVLQPSVEFETGFPGEAWLKGVTAAVNRVIEMGVADEDRIGIQGTSYGGYATNLLITQTNRFKAAINISGKVNMVSFYTDSPRLGVRNIHAPEKSQDRIGATLWQQPHKYLEHSAILYADRIKTPLLLITGEEDHNVPARQAMEMYYALRRLNKTVTWVNYVNGGHGMPTSTVEEVQDYHKRILDWYGEHLAPKKKPETPSPSGGQ